MFYNLAPVGLQYAFHGTMLTPDHTRGVMSHLEKPFKLYIREAIKIPIHNRLDLRHMAGKEISIVDDGSEVSESLLVLISL